ncbi:hypothetical protein BS47DRAFT_969444 [Hydnum rufescens UP504]|uniref:Uncharacterized protein n=1 Tax=Hydnum rufescens UP504 TaxID=1448309 RepID=A0A9P6AXE1_9AGAM|nr:hypothetical protein BS47DRAFT_969444 [Hydnum rufescens UP504]
MHLVLPWKGTRLTLYSMDSSSSLRHSTMALHCLLYHSCFLQRQAELCFPPTSVVARYSQPYLFHKVCLAWLSLSPVDCLTILIIQYLVTAVYSYVLLKTCP